MPSCCYTHTKFDCCPVIRDTGLCFETFFDQCSLPLHRLIYFEHVNPPAVAIMCDASARSLLGSCLIFKHQPSLLSPFCFESYPSTSRLLAQPDTTFAMSGIVKRRGHRIRQLGDAQAVQTTTNNNHPVAQAEALVHSNMDSSQLLARAFRDLPTAGSSNIQPGTWAADLAFLVSDDIAATTYLQSADLGTINKRFSISTYLSSAGVNQVAPNVILHKSQPIDGALLACLALNEECRTKGNAAFYHLPSRQKVEVGHAADQVFVLKSWTREAKHDWDNAGWLERLAMYGVDENCYCRSRPLPLTRPRP